MDNFLNNFYTLSGWIASHVRKFDTHVKSLPQYYRRKCIVANRKAITIILSYPWIYPWINYPSIFILGRP